MQWNHYIYNRIGDGVAITKYLPGEAQEESVITLPSHIDGLPVTEIGAEAFTENGAFLSEIEVPSTVRRIGEGAFKLCMSLSRLILHDGLEEIGEDALYLTPLSEVTLPDTVRRIGAPWELSVILFSVSEHHPYFYTDGICLYQNHGGEKELLVACQQTCPAEYRVADGTTAIGEGAFAGSNTLERIVLPDTLCVIGENAFSHCIRLREIHLPAAVESIGRGALSDTFGWSETLVGLEKITADGRNPHFMTDGNALYEIGEDKTRYIVKYFGAGLSWEIPEDVSRILPGAFRRAGFRRCRIPESVKDVGRDAFRECARLEELELAESGVRLYVPREPVYRKDEITALLFSAERESRERQDLGALPEKWKDFAAYHPKTERPPRRSLEGYVYDYRGYDALFPTYRSLRERCGMACCRLMNPVLLEEDASHTYRAFLEENLTDILHDISKMQDMDRLAALAELGLFTVANIEECLDVFAQTGRTKCTGFLLNYKREHLGESDFDFSL
ncbi:MAG: leucine-rich repeat domain-containing protein [Clostridiales bacterium]|nr:leucine-rich repeat domain-containing protein [Clostridiales bacterium]